MRFAPNIAGPSLRIVHTQLRAALGYLGFSHFDERPDQYDLGVSSRSDRVCHRGHKLLSAIRVNYVVASVCSDHDSVRVNALRKAGRDGEKNAIAKRDYRLFHRFLFVVTLRDAAAALQQVRSKKLLYKI